MYINSKKLDFTALKVKNNNFSDSCTNTIKDNGLCDRFTGSSNIKVLKSKKQKNSNKLINIIENITLLAGGLVFSTFLYIENTGLKPDPVTKNIGWKNNVSVLASSSQDGLTKAFKKYYRYTGALVDLLRKDEINGLGEANKILINNGYKTLTRTQYPVQTPGNIDCWNKDDNDVKRFALLISGKDNFSLNPISLNPVPFSKNSMELMEETIKDKNIFNVPDKNILKVEKADWSEVRNGIDWLDSNVLVNPDEKIEILVYYSGHSTIYGNEGKLEGDKLGVWENGFSEKALKEYINFPDNVKVIIIIDSCYSGAFIG